MLRYDRQTKPGLVALYDIRPGNRAGLFLQPRTPHGASTSKVKKMSTVIRLVDCLDLHGIFQHQQVTCLYNPEARTGQKKLKEPIHEQQCNTD